ncbi:MULTISPECIES: MBL fold metallo-hydrolase [unclassified Streptomyces]|uniref:MBL fold metallo-hydrolase n=1 Tax=unclassified Streptomyces TaxID=2593676 RepID=UPI001BECFA96|nr:MULTISPECIES: MBL fold metallo-hydrolase [unclassified Streptomyces]MBT2404362.1 MBL fold metallo-hydrolase [Streptomyces sp. ISL-21]MBT2607087.1 MBL fold metallo-hydrolase [Streptomyces sp. ISL-87]
MDVRWEEAGWEQLTGRSGRRRLPVWDCTVGLVVGDEGILMIDPGSCLREGAQLRSEAERLTGRSVTHIAFTHGHFDHVLGGAAFAGTEVYGAVGLDTELSTGREELRDGAVRHGLAADEAAEAADLLVLPKHLVSGEWTLELGGVQVLLANVGPGHTRHDLAVFVPGEREVVFCGDLVEESGEPQAGRDAVPARWPAAMDRLLSLGGDDALYVPGHGAVVSADFVRAQRDTLRGRFGVSDA